MRSLEWNPHALVADDNLTENLSLKKDMLLTILAFLRVLDDMEASQLAALHEPNLCGTQLVVVVVIDKPSGHTSIKSRTMEISLTFGSSTFVFIKVACSMVRDWESRLTRLELVQEMTDKVVLVKEKPKAARDRQTSYVVYGRKPLEFEVGDRVWLKDWLVAYRLRLPEDLNSMHDTFHVLNLKRCLEDANLHVPLDEIKVDKTLSFVEEPVEIMDQKIKKLKGRKIALMKVRWISKHGHEFTCEHEEQMRIKYPRLFMV
nr:putative reverse transcriptase domain-containing protein [Tanacetum cinerariifolium]